MSLFDDDLSKDLNTFLRDENKSILFGQITL